MNNHEKFTKLFLEFEEETKKKIDKNLTLEECTNKLKEKGYNPLAYRYLALTDFLALHAE